MNQRSFLTEGGETVTVPAKPSTRLRMALVDHQALLRLYGTTPGRSCKDCVHFLRFRQAASWSKCELARMTSSEASDWRAGWQACGRFQEGEKR